MNEESRPRKDRGLDATNREFARYDQVEKRQEYRLAEDGRHPASEEFDEDFRVRTCDIGRFLHGDEQDRAGFAEELGQALQEIGFAILDGHGIDLELYEECEQEVLRMFTSHSLEEKLRYRAARHGSVNQGYFPVAETTEIHPDLVEGWVFCRRAFDLGAAPAPAVTDFWPSASAEVCFRRMVQAHERLFLPVMQSILRYLGCDPHLYDERLTGTNFGLRLNYYPPVPPGSQAGRLLGHEDTDLFTLLPAPASEGLQVLNRRNFRWVRLEAPRGTIVLNTGDYMQRISGDVLPSTTHRVSQPRDSALRLQPRVSFPTNVYLWEDELLEVLPGCGESNYEPVRAIEFHTRTTAKYYGDDYAVDAPDRPRPAGPE